MFGGVLDGTRVIVAVGNRVLLYNAETGDLLESLRGHKDVVYCVHYSFDGSRFASGGADKIVVIWKSTGQGMLKYNHTASIQCVKYSPTTLQLASCSEVDFGMWTPEQKQVVKEKVQSKILCAAWSSDGTILALGMLNGWISIRNVNSDELHHIERRAPIWSLQFIPGTGASAGAAGVPSASQKNSNSNGSASPTGASGNQDSDLLVVGCWDKTLSLYRLNGSAHRIQGERPLRCYPCSISLATLSGNRTNYMVIAGSNRKVNLYSRDGLRLADLVTKESWIWAASCHGESDRVMIGTGAGGIDMVQIKFQVVHTLYMDRYAYRENLTEVVVHHLLSDRKVRIKCRDYIQRLSLYKNKLAVQLSDKICIYESNPEETLDMHFRLRRERIQQSANIPCEHMLLAANNLIFCSTNMIQLYTFDGQLQRTWILDTYISYVKMNGGLEGREAILVALQNGMIYKIFIDNPFPLELYQGSQAVLSLDLSLNRDKLAIINGEHTLYVIDIKTQDVLYQATNVMSVCFNIEVDDMICYSTEKSMYVMSGLKSNAARADDSSSDSRKQYKESLDEPQEQRISGLAIGFNGQKIYCLNKNAMVGIDVPQGGNIAKLLEKEDYQSAYHLACLGATENDWKLLAMKSLRANQLTIAKNSFARLKDSKFLYLIEAIERDTGHQGGGGNAQQVVVEASTPAVPVIEKRERIRPGGLNSKNQTAASVAVPPVSKSILEPSWQAELLAYQGHHYEAAKLYSRVGKVNEAIRLFTDLRMWNDAKMFAQNMGINYDQNILIQQQAKWLEEINDWKGASEMYLNMNKYTEAVKLILDAIPEQGWQGSLIDVVRVIPVEYKDILTQCGEIFTQYNEDIFARETYLKLGDISKLMALYIKKQMWGEAARLADENEGKFDSNVFLPYAEWLISQDRSDEAMQAYKKAKRFDLAKKVLCELTYNAVVECRYKDASYFYWLLSKDQGDPSNPKDDPCQLEYEHNADLYYAYSHIFSYITDPFTNQSPDLLFQVSRYIINSLGSSESIPYGISKTATLYSLAKQAMMLGGYKLARNIYDKLSKLYIQAKWIDEIEYDMLVVQAKPVRDEPEHLPVCYRCSSTNPLLNPFTNKFAKGDVCTNCGHPFVRSFINFDILPLVEFVPEPSISDEEAIELIRTHPNSSSKSVKGSEGKIGDAEVFSMDPNDSHADMMGMTADLRGGMSPEEMFTTCLNKTLENQSNAMSYIPVTVDTATLLHGMKRSEVFVCRPSTPNKRATFYKNMLPEIAIAISQSCHRFFHLEDFEFAYLSNKSCPYSRVKDVGEYGSL